jgi:putative transport protein
MNLFETLLAPGNTNLASTLVLYSFVIAAGIYLGKMKIGGISLGVTFVLFVGILMGHFGYIVDPEVLHFVREFGLILFIFAIGLQVGPAFFSSFKKGGVRMNLLAVLIVALNVGITLIIYALDNGHTSIAELVGVMSGAVTNTPGLAAAQQAVTDNPDVVNRMSMGYAAAYPLGVCGIILSMLIIRWVFRIDVEQEAKSHL